MNKNRSFILNTVMTVVLIVVGGFVINEVISTHVENHLNLRLKTGLHKERSFCIEKSDSTGQEVLEKQSE